MASIALTDLNILTTQVESGTRLSCSAYITLDVGVLAQDVGLQVSFYDASQNLIMSAEHPSPSKYRQDIQAGAGEVQLRLDNVKIPSTLTTTKAHYVEENKHLQIKVPADFSTPPTAGTVPVISVQVGLVFSGTPTGTLTMRRIMFNRGTNAAPYAEQATSSGSYTHPTYTAQVETADTGPLSFANVISDIEVVIQSDAEGHLTNAAANVSTRVLTLADIGYTGSPTANDYTHSTHAGDDINVDTTALTGATIVSDIDINVTTDTEGHVTDANGTVLTRELTPADIGALGLSGKAADSELLDGIDSIAFAQKALGESITGSWTFTNDITFSGDLVSTSLFQITGITDLDTDVRMRVGNKLILDGTLGSGVGNSYLQADIEDNIRTVINDIEVLNVNSAGAQLIGTLSSTGDVTFSSDLDVTGAFTGATALLFSNNANLLTLSRDTGTTSVSMQFTHTAGTKFLGIDSTGILKVGSTSALNSTGTEIWHSGNDGAGSGLDADTLDGIDSTGFSLAAHDHTGVYQELGSTLFVGDLDTLSTPGDVGNYSWNALFPTSTLEPSLPFSSYKNLICTFDGGQMHQFVWGGISNTQGIWMRRNDSGVWTSFTSVSMSGHDHDADYLGIAATAANSTLIGNTALSGLVLRSSDFSGDLDTVFTNSNFRVNNTATNAPTADFYATQVYGNTGNVTGQLATHFVSGDTYTRSYNSVWNTWAKQLSDQNFVLDVDYLTPNSTLFTVSDGSAVQGHPAGGELRFTGTAPINIDRLDIGTGESQIRVEHAGGDGNRHIPSGGVVGQVLENNALGNVVWVDQSTLDAGTLDGLNSTSFARSDAPDTITASWDFTHATSGIGANHGIDGRYSSTGAGTTWGSTIWALDDSFNGTTSGVAYLPTSLYGAAWIRSTNTEARAAVGEGMYLYQNGTFQVGMGTIGIDVAGNLVVSGNADLPTITGDTTFNGDLAMNVGTSFIAEIASFKQDVGIETGKRLYLDRELDVNGDTYIHHPSANTLELVVGGTVGIVLDTATATVTNPWSFNQITTFSSNLEIGQGSRIYFDGGVNDYIQGDVNNNIRTVVVGTERMNVDSTGVQVVGTLSATTINATSDIIKKNVIGVYSTTETIRDILPHSWTWKSEDLPSSVQVGYLAQHVLPILPEAVSEAEDGTLLLDYTAVHTAKIASLEREVFELKNLVKEVLNGSLK